MLEKRGIVDENTPTEKPCCGGGCKRTAQPGTKEAADKQEDHLSTRLSDAVVAPPKK